MLGEVHPRCTGIGRTGTFDTAKFFLPFFLFFLFGFSDKILTALSVYSSCFIIVKRTFINNFTLYRPYVYLILALYLGLHCLICPKYLRLGLLTLSPIYIGVSKVSLGVWVDF